MRIREDKVCKECGHKTQYEQMYCDHCGRHPAPYDTKAHLIVAETCTLDFCALCACELLVY